MNDNTKETISALDELKNRSKQGLFNRIDLAKITPIEPIKQEAEEKEYQRPCKIKCVS